MDADLQSVQQVRDLLARASRAQETLNRFTQAQVDAICAAMAEAGFTERERLAKLAVEETGIGRVESKIAKNELATRTLWEAMKEMKTVGIVRRDDRRMVYEIAEPVGVVAGIIPTTNPTSTALFKILISLKARNAIVLSPHPRAVRCIAECARVLYEAALRAGAPEGAIGCMEIVTLQGTQELMRHRQTKLILATGGSALVEAAYSSGKPAYGVGPGNVPAVIERSADVRWAVTKIVESQLFDYATICASEQSVIVDEGIRDAVVEEFRRQRAYFVTPDEKKKMDPVVIQGSLMNPDVVGKSPAWIAKRCGFTVPEETSVLLVPLSAVGPQEPLSREKLCPVLGFYVERDWQACCERAIQVLEFGGMGHTLVIHSRSPEIIMEFALKKPAHRLLANTGASLGAVGGTTRLFPSLTLGCGTWAGNITTDNVGPHNLLNIKRLALDPSDPFASTMAGKVGEALVSGFVPFKDRPAATPAYRLPLSPPASAGAEPRPAGGAGSAVYSPAEIQQILLYNGRRRDVRAL